LVTVTFRTDAAGLIADFGGDFLAMRDNVAQDGRDGKPTARPSRLLSSAEEGKHKEKARSWLFQQTAGSNSRPAWIQLQATENVKTNEAAVKGPGLQFCCRGRLQEDYEHG
jgi:hypothetical protein